MYVSWGDLKFSVIKVSDYVVKIIYSEDGTTYLWDTTTIRLQCVLNPDVNAGATLSPPNGESPAQTFITVLSKLRKPRQKLKVWQKDDLNDAAKENVVLESPLQGYVTDANNGPTCHYHGLTTDKGTGSIIWDLEFSTDINMCKGDYGDPALILQNRYSMRVTYDPETYRQAYEYQGVAIFRTDVLRKKGYSPDQFRKSLLPAVLPGYQRHPVSVVLNDGNSALAYHVVDRYMPKSQPLNSKFRIAELHISEQRGYVSNFDTGLLQGARDLGGVVADGIKNEILETIQGVTAGGIFSSGVGGSVRNLIK